MSSSPATASSMSRPVSVMVIVKSGGVTAPACPGWRPHGRVRVVPRLRRALQDRDTTRPPGGDEQGAAVDVGAELGAGEGETRSTRSFVASDATAMPPLDVPHGVDVQLAHGANVTGVDVTLRSIVRPSGSIALPPAHTSVVVCPAGLKAPSQYRSGHHRVHPNGGPAPHGPAAVYGRGHREVRHPSFKLAGASDWLP